MANYAPKPEGNMLGEHMDKGQKHLMLGMSYLNQVVVAGIEVEVARERVYTV